MHVLVAGSTVPCVLQVELDAAVLEAATAAMGLPAQRRNLRLHCADGAAWVAAAAAAVRAAEQPPLDLVLLDAFDGGDAVPACFTQPGGELQERKLLLALQCRCEWAALTVYQGCRLACVYMSVSWA